MSHYTDFDELGPQKPKEPLEYQVRDTHTHTHTHRIPGSFLLASRISTCQLSAHACHVLAFEPGLPGVT